jgi:hypothetical protein
VLLIFRPFLVAAYALQKSRSTKLVTQMWLRQACRRAVDASQDFIIYASNTIANSPIFGVSFAADHTMAENLLLTNRFLGSPVSSVLHRMLLRDSVL